MAFIHSDKYIKRSGDQPADWWRCLEFQLATPTWPHVDGEVFTAVKKTDFLHRANLELMAFCSEIVQKREVIKLRKTFEKEQQQTNKNGLKNKTGEKI